MSLIAHHFDQPIHDCFLDKSQFLEISILIQTAYEHEHPLSIVYQSETEQYHFCGYIDQIDPYERWIQLRNGCLKEQIFFPDIISIDMY